MNPKHDHFLTESGVMIICVGYEKLKVFFIEWSNLYYLCLSDLLILRLLIFLFFFFRETPILHSWNKPSANKNTKVTLRLDRAFFFFCATFWKDDFSRPKKHPQIKIKLHFKLNKFFFRCLFAFQVAEKSFTSKYFTIFLLLCIKNVTFNLTHKNPDTCFLL